MGRRVPPGNLEREKASVEKRVTSKSLMLAARDVIEMRFSIAC